MADEGCGSSGILWFLAGLGIGAAVGVLYAPKAGSETRESLLNAAGDGRDLVQERARKYKQQAQEWADRGKDVISQQKENIRSAFEAGRKAYRDANDEPTPEPGTPNL
ncbi:MAG: YtxH domain-containing protein [Acidobacteria bacterium]|nr:MAG: YtxH domain-containing protein [Acidobacteriota bacterium]